MEVSNYIVRNISISNNSSDSVFGHSLSASFTIPISVYFIFLIIGGVSFNGILIHIIISSESLHTPTNSFIINLAVCDLLTAILILPFEADYLLRGYYCHGLFFCGLKETMLMLSLPSSIVNLLLLTLERFVKIVFPYRYDYVYTNSNVRISIACSWTYTLAVALFPIIYNPNAAVEHNGVCMLEIPSEYILYQLIVNFVIPVIGILVMNGTICNIAGKHAHRLQKRNASFCPQANMSGRPSYNILIASTFKTAKTIMILVGLIIFCWLSYIILLTANVVCNICHPREITWSMNAVNYSCIAFNPVLYGLLNKNIRTVLMKKYAKRLYSKQFLSIKYTTNRPTSRTIHIEAVSLAPSPRHCIPML